MEETITFHLTKKDKELIFQQAEKQRLTASAFCRFIIIHEINKKLESPTLRDEDSSAELNQQND